MLLSEVKEGQQVWYFQEENEVIRKVQAANTGYFISLRLITLNPFRDYKIQNGNAKWFRPFMPETIETISDDDACALIRSSKQC